MTLPSSPTLARRAIETALSTVTGQPSALGAPYLFRIASLAEVAQNTASLKSKPAALVTLRDPRIIGAERVGDITSMEWTVAVTCWYWTGSDVMPTKIGGEVDKARERIEGDPLRIFAALTYPGALATYDGSETGLAGGALRSDVYTASGPSMAPAIPQNEARIAVVTHTFVASLDLATP